MREAPDDERDTNQIYWFWPNRIDQRVRSKPHDRDDADEDGEHDESDDEQCLIPPTSTVPKHREKGSNSPGSLDKVATQKGDRKARGTKSALRWKTSWTAKRKPSPESASNSL
jgi:hypothetical protein